MLRLLKCPAGLLLVLVCFQAGAATGNHAAQAERLLEVTRADRLSVPIYAQVQEVFAQRFAQAGGAAPNKALLERYLARANAALDRAIGWDRLRPELVDLYAQAFSEQELQHLLEFYQSELGRKVLTTLPELNMRAARIAQGRVEQVAPEINKLLADMTAELEKQ